MAQNIQTVLSDKEALRVGTCTATQGLYVVTVDRKSYDRWLSGEPSDKAFPDLKDEQRWFLDTGTTPAEWLEAFACGSGQ